MDHYRHKNVEKCSGSSNEENQAHIIIGLDGLPPASCPRTYAGFEVKYVNSDGGEFVL